MKKYLLLLLPLLFFGCVSTNVEMPLWVTDYHKEFPDDVYLVQKNSGKTPEEAKNEALASISYYMNSTVEGIRSSNFTHNELNENGELSVTEESESVRNTVVSTSSSLFGVQYTEPWYNKKEKLFYCVCYINREEAWRNFEPQVRIEKDSFISFYQKAEDSSKNFEKIKFYNYALEQSKVFLEKVSYAQLFSEELTTEAFGNDIQLISSIKKKQKEIISNSPIYINVTNESTNEVSSIVEKVFKDCGFNISSKKNENVYIANCNLIFNQYLSGEIIVCNPSFEIKLSNNTEEAYSLLIDCNSVKAYTNEQIIKKATKSICNELESKFENDFKTTLSGKK